MTPEEFVAELDRNNDIALGRIEARVNAPLEDRDGEKREPLAIAKLLILALKNELEATECAANWLASTPEVDVKLALARQAGDEAKHYRLIQKRLAEMGVDTSSHDPFAAPQSRSPLLAYLAQLPDTCSRVAAGQFTRESLALVRNRAFIEFCKSHDDDATAKLYEDVIQPDEQHHHELGRSLLMKLATTDDAQSRAREASAKVLAMAEELGEILRLKLNAVGAPGC